MKELKTIQTLSKIGKVLSNIVFVFCVVGFCLCAVGAVGVAVGFDAIKLGNVTVQGLVQSDGELSKAALVAVLTAGAIVCAAEAVLARFAVHYFARELKDGTPFTRGGARELQRLGILAICLPLGGQILAQIVCSILAETLPNASVPDLEYSGSVGLGIMMLVMAQVCKYGAALADGRVQTENRGF